jgi:hypothetical protein
MRFNISQITILSLGFQLVCISASLAEEVNINKSFQLLGSMGIPSSTQTTDIINFSQTKPKTSMITIRYAPTESETTLKENTVLKHEAGRIRIVTKNHHGIDGEAQLVSIPPQVIRIKEPIGKDIIGEIAQQSDSVLLQP